MSVRMSQIYADPEWQGIVTLPVASRIWVPIWTPLATAGDILFINAKLHTKIYEPLACLQLQDRRGWWENLHYRYELQERKRAYTRIKLKISLVRGRARRASTRFLSSEK